MAINALIGLMGRPVQQVDTVTPRLQNAHATLYEEQAARARQQQAEEQTTMQALGQAMSSQGGMSAENVAKIARVNPRAAMAIQGIASKQQSDQLAMQGAARAEQSAALDVKGKEFDLQTKKIGRLSNRLSSIADPVTFKRAIYGAMSDGDLDEAMGQQFLQADYNDPQTQAMIKSMVGDAQTALQKTEEQRKAAAEGRAVAGEGRAVAMAGPQLDKAKLDVEQAQLEVKYKDMRNNGATPEQIQAQRQLDESIRHNQRSETLTAQGQSLTARGQDMTDRRSREQNAISMAGLKPMSAEASKVFSIAESMVPELEELKAAIQANPRGAAAGILSGTDTHLARLASNAADKVGRLRSGGAVNPNEEARFMAQIARWMDVAQGDSSSAVKAIEGLIEEARGVSAQMRPQRPMQPPLAPNGFEADGFRFPSKSAIDAYLKAKGGK